MKNKFNYVDGFVLPVPKNKLAAYKKLAKLSSKIWRDHGAIEYVETVSEDVKPGKWTSFPQSVKLKKGEVVIFSWVTYKTKAARDRANKKIMTDPRMIKMMNDGIPFDGKRMIYGGFKALVKA